MTWSKGDQFTFPTKGHALLAFGLCLDGGDAYYGYPSEVVSVGESVRVVDKADKSVPKSKEGCKGYTVYVADPCHAAAKGSVAQVVLSTWSTGFPGSAKEIVMGCDKKAHKLVHGLRCGSLTSQDSYSVQFEIKPLAKQPGWSSILFQPVQAEGARQERRRRERPVLQPAAGAGREAVFRRAH